MNGIHYVGVGNDHYNEAVASAHRLRGFITDDVKISLTTNMSCEHDVIFDNVTHIDDVDYSPLIKIRAIAQSDFDRTLFLDTDTYVCAVVMELFTILDRFDMAAVWQPNRRNWPAKDVPQIFPEVNSGVIAYRKCSATDTLFSAWERAYIGTEQPLCGDQGALREALWNTDIRLCILPSEWNLRVDTPAFVFDAVRIIHGRGDLEAIRQGINKARGPRIYNVTK